mgnify:CR=1 FL=1
MTIRLTNTTNYLRTLSYEELKIFSRLLADQIDGLRYSSTKVHDVADAIIAVCKKLEGENTNENSGRRGASTPASANCQSASAFGEATGDPAT